jgi:hypothetical protein
VNFLYISMIVSFFFDVHLCLWLRVRFCLERIFYGVRIKKRRFLLIHYLPLDHHVQSYHPPIPRPCPTRCSSFKSSQVFVSPDVLSPVMVAPFSSPNVACPSVHDNINSIVHFQLSPFMHPIPLQSPSIPPSSKHLTPSIPSLVHYKPYPTQTQQASQQTA